MTKKKWFLLALVAVTAFTVGYGAVAKAFPTPYHYGYFKNQHDTAGIEVLPPWGGPSGCQGNGLALPMWVDTADEFINFTVCKLGGDYRNHIGAAFIISTMTGMKNDYPGATEINEFAARVRYAASLNRINFNVATSCVLPNTFYQDGPGDVGAYGGCGTSSVMVVFSGGPTPYTIKRYCFNPVGDMAPIPDDVNFTITGSTAITNGNTTPLPGQTVQFSYYIRNLGPTSTAPTPVWWGAFNAATGTGVVPSAPYGVMNPGGDVLVHVENYVVPAATPAGTQICRQTGWDPVNSSGGRDGRGPIVCATVRYDFTLTPSITVQVNGATSAGNVAEQGDTISFSYAVVNSGLTQSQTVTCTYRQASYTGYSTTPPVTTFTPAGANCAPTRTFPAGSTTVVATEGSVVAGTANTSICRSFTITPTVPGGGTQTVQGCAFVMVKPYTRVYGGDVVAGGAVETAPGSCTSNAGAAVIGWNKRGGGAAGWAGAGVQYAAYAADVIFDFASGLGNPPASASTAPKPLGLAFRNNTGTDQNNGNFGGEFGSGPCIRDHYGTLPTSGVTTLGATTSANLSTGTYSRVGNLQLNAGTVAAGNKVNIYVDGNVYITGNATYGGSGSWTSTNIPMLRVIVLGNIYIDNDVTQLDGLYVAQPDGATDGIIYTCALTASTIPARGGSMGSDCDTKLTVNGSFIAKQVWLMRTIGTLRGSLDGAADPSSSGNIAEVFNYSPMLWISQPTTSSSVGNYDAINSLPPVL